MCLKAKHNSQYVFVVCIVIMLATLLLGTKKLTRVYSGPICSVPLLNDVPSIPAQNLSVLLVAPKSLTTKDLIIRSVYLDSRPRGGHDSACVFMVEIHKHVLAKNSIVSCTVGSTSTAHFKVCVVKGSDWVHDRHSECTHEQAMVDCFDVSAENGSRAYISFNSTTIVAVESERPLFIPAPCVPPRNDKTVTVMACALIYGTPPVLENWLCYQKTIGVDHVYLIADKSFGDAGNLERSPLNEMIRGGYVSVEIWTPYLTAFEIFYHSQMLGYEDCIYRFQGTYDYAFTYDPDVFFVPLVLGELSIQYYAERFCSKGSCTFRQIQYFLDCGVSEVGADGNVTAHLLSNKSFNRPEGRGLHKLYASVDVGIHSALKLRPGYVMKIVPASLAYVAHISPGYAEKLPGREC